MNFIILSFYRCLYNDPHVTSSWATGGVETWNHLKPGCKSLATPFNALAEKGAKYVSFHLAFILKCRWSTVVKGNMYAISFPTFFSDSTIDFYPCLFR